MLAVAVGASLPGHVRADTTALFPDAQPPLRPDGAPRTIALGSGRISITSWRFTPLPGRSEAVNAIWCGVVLRDQNRASRGIVTIGKDFTEALSCGGLIEAGAVPSKAGMARIGLVYRTASPNASVITPIVLARDPATAVWSIDATASERLALSRQKTTLERMRRELALY